MISNLLNSDRARGIKSVPFAVIFVTIYAINVITKIPTIMKAGSTKDVFID